jgi:hypothetical protein
MFGQAEERDHVAVIEIGGAGDWGLTGGPASLGGTVAAEVTPIEHWLELESGVTAFGTNGRRDVSADLLFKKPFPVSSGVELMAGAGPELSWKLRGAGPARSLAAELALDFMFWPRKNIGWYVEPSYSFTGFGARSDRSLGVTAGLLIGLP